VDFYIPFLTAIRERDTSGRIAILAQAHVGHTPGIRSTKSRDQDWHGSDFLSTNTNNVIETYDILKDFFSSARVILVGHSVGAWIALQVNPVSKTLCNWHVTDTGSPSQK
jgi:pimeloyl-ACP methyl ester carboxylesterase